jgi:hypothetical protein
LNAITPSLLPSFPRCREREKIKTNPSVSPFRKGRDKNENFFNSPLFLKRGTGRFYEKKRKAKK